MSKTDGKGLSIRPDSEEVAGSKPYLIRVDGKRYLCSDGRFHTDLVVSFLKERARREWLGISDIAKTFVGAPTLDGKKKARRSMSPALRALLEENEFLVYQIGPMGRITHVKLLDPSNEVERQAAEVQLMRMERMRQLSADKVAKAYNAIAVRQQAQTPVSPDPTVGASA